MPASYRNGNRVMRWKKRHVISGILLFLLIWILASAWQIVSFSRKSELREADTAIVLGAGVVGRSEEHTSELQSQR